MNNVDPDKPESELTEVTNEVLKIAPRIAALPTEELLAAMGGFFVVGVMAGGMFWVPFAMTFLISLRRLYLFYESRELRKLNNELERYRLLGDAREREWNRELPEDVKRRSLSDLDRLLEESDQPKKQIGS